MDAIVEAALKKWPNVPACTGWLGLDARGQWWMRDDATQAHGSFQAGCTAGDSAMKGSLLKHDKLIAFIQRNYGIDERGFAWFQNGPQRVFVELEAAPYCLRLHEDGRMTATAGSSSHERGEQTVCARSSWLDEQGHLYVAFEQTLGRVHSQDMHLALAFLENGRLPAPTATQLAGLQAHFGYALSPQARAAA